jgi:hypothetical protein
LTPQFPNDRRSASSFFRKDRQPCFSLLKVAGLSQFFRLKYLFSPIESAFRTDSMA